MSNPFLTKLGFGRNLIKELVSGESFEAPDSINLAMLIDDNSKILSNF